MSNGIRIGDPHGFNKGRSLKFREVSRVRQIPEEGLRTHRPKCCGNNHKDEDNSPKTHNDENNNFTYTFLHTLYLMSCSLYYMTSLSSFQSPFLGRYIYLFIYSFVLIPLFNT